MFQSITLSQVSTLSGRITTCENNTITSGQAVDGTLQLNQQGGGRIDIPLPEQDSIAFWANNSNYIYSGTFYNTLSRSNSVYYDRYSFENHTGPFRVGNVICNNTMRVLSSSSDAGTTSGSQTMITTDSYGLLTPWPDITIMNKDGTRITSNEYETIEISNVCVVGSDNKGNLRNVLIKSAPGENGIYIHMIIYLKSNYVSMYLTDKSTISFY